MDTYIVKDLYEASFLYASGKRLVELRNQGSYKTFVFEDCDACESLANQYWSGRATVNAKALTDAQRTLKDFLFAH